MPVDEITTLKEYLENDREPDRLTVNARIDAPPLLTIEFGFDFIEISLEHGTNVSDERDFITPELIRTSPTLLVELEVDPNSSVIYTDNIHVRLVDDTSVRSDEFGEEVVAHYYSITEDRVMETQQTAWHLTHRASDDPDVYAFV